MPSDCVICKLLSGELEVSMVYQDPVCSAFMDIQPISPGHMLVVSNKHSASLSELDEEDGAQIFRVGQRLAVALGEIGVKCEGVNFFLANGEAAGQDVFHVNLHVFPRYSGDGFRLILPADYEEKPKRTELDKIAAQVRQALKY